jgi:Ca2+-binding EF-hand superfamily protein
LLHGQSDRNDERRCPQEDEEATLDRAFDSIDIQKNDQITAEDLQCFMPSLGEDFDIKTAKWMSKAAKQGMAPFLTREQYKSVLRGKWTNARGS